MHAKRGALKAMILAAATAASLAALPHAFAQSEPRAYDVPDAGAVTLIVRITVASDRRDEFLALIASRARQGRSDPAVTAFRVLGTDDPSTFVTIESFRTAAGFDVFEQAPASKVFIQKLTPLMTQPPQVQRLHGLS